MVVGDENKTKKFQGEFEIISDFKLLPLPNQLSKNNWAWIPDRNISLKLPGWFQIAAIVGKYE